MKSAMNDRRLLTDVLHDVDLAAIGPVRSVDVVTQHPKCRPNTLAVGNLNPRLKPSVGLAELILSKQSCRSVVATYAIRPGQGFLDRLDHQQATGAIRVCSAARVGFELVVTPAVAANIKGPLA